MIRVAVSEDFLIPLRDESAVRILSLYEAYGEVSFIRFYSDGVGGLLSIMDGVGIFSPADTPSEEWIAFIGMNPDIHTLHCSQEIGEQIVAGGSWQGRFGKVLRYEGEERIPSAAVCRTPSLPAVYALLQTCFPSLADFDYWYPDVSHRVRHGCCHISCVVSGEEVISTAMTVAETSFAVILGQVATAQSHRRKGYAAQCLFDLISQCKAKVLYIPPVNENAEKLYVNLGFRPCGGWAELERI